MTAIIPSVRINFRFAKDLFLILKNVFDIFIKFIPLLIIDAMVTRHPLYAKKKIYTRSSSRNTKVTLIQPRNDFRDAQGMLAGARETVTSWRK